LSGEIPADPSDASMPPEAATGGGASFGPRGTGPAGVVDGGANAADAVGLRPTLTDRAEPEVPAGGGPTDGSSPAWVANGVAARGSPPGAMLITKFSLAVAFVGPADVGPIALSTEFGRADERGSRRPGSLAEAATWKVIDATSG
jgi:hypothetical protein